MKSTTLILATLSSISFTLADSTTNPFTAAGTDDLRGPCPMLNSLANHGFLPHSGAGITADDISTAFDVALNINATGLSTFTNAALAASTTGNSSTFNLNDLDAHGILEHDGSLSRADIFFGDNHSFNASVWAGTKEILSSGGDNISITTAGTARSSRFALDKTQNPTFNMTATNIQISALESALYLTTFGDPVNGNAVNSFVNVFFEEERLPFTEGWTRPTTEATITTLQTMANLIAAVTV